jgi:hypothetical protein
MVKSVLETLSSAPESRKTRPYQVPLAWLTLWSRAHVSEAITRVSGQDASESNDTAFGSASFLKNIPRTIPDTNDI